MKSIIKAVFSESEELEFKSSTGELKEAIISISAMLNRSRRGTILFGITDKGKVIGQDISNNTIREISRSISEKIEPKIYPEIREELIENRNCIRVSFAGLDVPYSADGRFYLRIGDEDRRLSTAEVTKIILENKLKNLRWDTQLCSSVSNKDISVPKVHSFLKLAGLNSLSATTALSNLNLMSKGGLTNTAVLLFAKTPEKFFPNAKLRCAVFGGVSTSYIIDRQEYSGDVFLLIKKAEEYILKNIHLGMRIEGLQREDVPEINREAIREVVINAFCHRDYFDLDSITVLVFSNRIEVRNPGVLMGGLTIRDIISKKVSKRRNELICDIFHRARYVEKFGRGIAFILEREPDARFEQVGDVFISTLFRKNIEDANMRLVNGLANGLVNDLADKQKLILKLINTNPKVSIKELSMEVHLSTTAIDGHIKKLKDLGHLRRVGNKRSGYWEIVNK